MDGEKIYRITTGDYTPTGRWDEYPHLMDFRHAARTAVKKIWDASGEEFSFLLNTGMTVWGGSLEIVTLHIGGRVTYAHELEPAEGKYIATALANAIHERQATFQ